MSFHEPAQSCPHCHYRHSAHRHQSTVGFQDAYHQAAARSEQSGCRGLRATIAGVPINSFDALVPQDMNGTEDVYEWEREDVGSR